MQERTSRTLLGISVGASAALLAFVPLWQVGRALVLASYTTLGRDQGIFQYTAWAAGRGVRLYQDLRDINGPLITAVHGLFLALGGADEHRFRTLDLVVTALSFLAAGVLAANVSQRRAWPERLLWGTATMVTLLVQYLRYLPWDLAQRESFADWFMLPGIALLLAPRRGTWAHAISGALLTASCFAKPTYALFVLFQGVVVVATSAPDLSRKQRALWFAAGAAACAVLAALTIMLVGDVQAFVRMYTVESRQLYGFIWPHTMREVYTLPWVTTPVRVGLGTSAAAVLLVVLRVLPLRALALALAPLAGFLSVAMQGKGFPYHLHPMSESAALVWVVSAMALAHHMRRPKTQDAKLPKRAIAGVLLFAVSGAVAAHGTFVMRGSPHILNPWTVSMGRTAEARMGRAYLDRFKMPDFFPYEMRQTADYLATHTPEDGTVQLFGMDPYLLFLSRRLSATPYIYSYDLNIDAAWNGASETLPEPKNIAARDRVKEMGDAHAKDLLERVAKKPAAAWVLFDRAPLSSYDTAEEDLRRTRPELSAYLHERYEEQASFGGIHVFLPRASDMKVLTAIAPPMPPTQAPNPAP